MNGTTTLSDVKRVHVSRPKPVDGHMVQRVTVWGLDGSKHIYNFLLPVAKQARRK